MLEEVLKFWFKEVTSTQWWTSDSSFDSPPRQRFLDLLRTASAGELFSWRNTAKECTFLLMPYMHSESRAIHAEAETLLRQFTPPKNYKFELQNKAIIDRFGRYLHRNQILGRTSTEEEAEFLKQPGSSF